MLTSEVGDMLCAERHRRVAVILPRYRRWLWHQRLISALQQTCDVDTFVAAEVPQYPLSLRLWMRLEISLIGQPGLVCSDTTPAAMWSHATENTYALVFNLSESPLARPHNTPVLEPRYNRSGDSLSLFSTLLTRKNPYLSFHLAGQTEPLVASYLAMPDTTFLVRGLQFSFARLLSLAERAAHRITLDCRAAPPPDPEHAPSSLFTPRILLSLARILSEKLVGRLVRLFRVQEHWSVALYRSSGSTALEAPKKSDLVILPDDRKRFYADPFLFRERGKDWLFVEEFDYRTRKGVISCAQVTGSVTTSLTPVLVRPYHLSYPFVFRSENTVYLLPETGGNRTVELYQARSFPFEWVLWRVLLQDIALYDATLLRYQDRWWIFGAVADNGGSTYDELAIFYSHRLEGPWLAHSLNPVKSDCRSARPAGRIIMRDNRLLRPAQDCESGYGAGLVWLEIEELTPDRFGERELARWTGAELGADGTHTFNCEGELNAIDLRYSIWKGGILQDRPRENSDRNASNNE